MAKLVLSDDVNVIDEFELTKEALTIGRRPTNDIIIDNLAVSGLHAKVLTILKDSFLEDLNSTNGTYVNGSLIKKHALQNGDIISIVKYQLKFINESKPIDEENFKKTMIIGPDDANMSGSHRAPTKESIGRINAGIKKAAKSIDTSSKAKIQASLKLLNGGNAGKELGIKKALITLGKPGVQVAAITRRATGYFITHIDGAEGKTHPTLNNNAITSMAIPLANGDIINVAGIKMEFLVK
jgi:pSer/pThr/pTyr-binding forkhead associated (FHA) protein